MAVLWKWSALAAALYGLLAVAAVLGPPRAQKQPPPRPGLGGKPGHQGSPGGIINFESGSPQPRNKPPSTSEIVAAADGNSYLRWSFPSFQRRASALILPLQPGGPYRQLSFSASAEEPLLLMLVLQEADGSSYAAEATIAAGWKEYALPLSDFELLPRSEDENRRLDPPELFELSLLHKGQRTAAGQQAAQISLELDDIALR